MIKFKNILFENVEYDGIEVRKPDEWERVPRKVYQKDMKKWIKEAKKLVKEINSGNWILPKNEKEYIYRGTSSVYPGWSIREIRKDREPRDTSQWLDRLLEKIREEFYSDIPSRRESKFGATSLSGREEVTRKYGPPHIVFVERGGKVYSRSQDAFSHTSEIEQDVSMVEAVVEDAKYESSYEEVKNELKVEFPYVHDYAYSLYNIKTGQVGTSFNGSIGGIVDLKKACKEAEEYFRQKKRKVPRSTSDVYMMFKKLAGFSKQTLKNFQRFYGRMKEGIYPDSMEVTFSGDTYLTVEESFWRHFIDFDFETQKASLNDNYKNI